MSRYNPEEIRSSDNFRNADQLRAMRRPELPDRNAELEASRALSAMCMANAKRIAAEREAEVAGNELLRRLRAA